MTADDLLLLAQALRARAPALPAAAGIDVVAHTGSTNSDLLEWRDGSPHIQHSKNSLSTIDGMRRSCKDQEVIATGVRKS